MNMLKQQAHKLIRFLEDTTGVAFIEFAFLVPLLMLMILGTFEAGRSIIVHKRFQRATAMVGDLIAREESLGSTNGEAKSTLDGIIRAAEHAMWPYSTAPLKIGVMSVRAAEDDPTDTKVEWAYSHQNMPVTQCPGAKGIPSGMITEGNTAILVESEYVYSPVILNAVPGLSGVKTYRDTVINAPRRSCVNYTGTDCSGVCP